MVDLKSSLPEGYGFENIDDPAKFKDPFENIKIDKEGKITTKSGDRIVLNKETGKPQVVMSDKKQLAIIEESNLISEE